MRQDADHETLGASLLSVAVLAGSLAWLLGWFALDLPPAPMLQDPGRWQDPLATPFDPPPEVEVSVLDGPRDDSP
ncbi:hypothetical protein KUW14_14815 [Pseudooceanicola nitratireducens]|uniref:hypothetical protein n=1 Tax=Pseudooceanicola nitratireducens TaxID=517719 RepID=UPI001C95F0FF|nr:hypothetical protein [Pseudooceanicola nitratireducens]MBY6167124.1 hypothetical protein [Pseudooceanicola nitratireducens]